MDNRVIINSNTKLNPLTHVWIEIYSCFFNLSYRLQCFHFIVLLLSRSFSIFFFHIIKTNILSIYKLQIETTNTRLCKFVSLFVTLISDVSA